MAKVAWDLPCGKHVCFATSNAVATYTSAWCEQNGMQNHVDSLPCVDESGKEWLTARAAGSAAEHLERMSIPPWYVVVVVVGWWVYWLLLMLWVW